MEIKNKDLDLNVERKCKSPEFQQTQPLFETPKRNNPFIKVLKTKHYNFQLGKITTSKLMKIKIPILRTNESKYNKEDEN